jgi:hypothetical protein
LQPPPRDRNACRNNSHHARHQGLSGRAGYQRNANRSAHDDHEPGRRQWCQLAVDVEDPGEHQAQRAEHFHDADEMEERARHGHLLRHGRDRHDELHRTREEEENGQEGLKSPEGSIGRA